jgi:hypothetical protein
MWRTFALPEPIEGYEEGVMKEGDVHKWRHSFIVGRTDVQNEVITGNLKDRVDAS